MTHTNNTLTETPCAQVHDRVIQSVFYWSLLLCIGLFDAYTVPQQHAVGKTHTKWSCPQTHTRARAHWHTHAHTHTTHTRYNCRQHHPSNPAGTSPSVWYACRNRPSSLSCRAGTSACVKTATACWKDVRSVELQYWALLASSSHRYKS